MKSAKFTLVAALAAGSFSFIEAKPLEEAIKNVDVSGYTRYRYESFSADWKEGEDLDFGGITSKQLHRFKASLGTKLDVGDNFKVFSELFYNSDKNDGFSGTGTQTKSPFTLRRAYLEYSFNQAKFVFGKEQLNTIWTADFVGMLAKGSYEIAKSVKLNVFAVDSFEGSDSSGSFEPNDGDAADFSAIPSLANAATMNSRFYKYNMYGAALQSEFDMGGKLNLDLWGAFWQNTASLYAVNLKYKIGFSDDFAYTFKASYLGNTVDNYFKNRGVDNGQLVDIKGFVKAYGFDGTVGGIAYGKKERVSFNTLEDTGNADLGLGKELFYQKGSWMVLSNGQSAYAYAGFGYTLPSDLRLGVQAIYGGTKIAGGSIVQNTASANAGAGEKLELVAETSLKYNKNLSFLAWYSHLQTKAKLSSQIERKSAKDTVRVQALYKF